jgi:hypothetical protein
MGEEFEDDVMMFLMKAIVVSGCVFALMPALLRVFPVNQTVTPLSGRLYLDPDTGKYWVYVPEEEK